MKTFLIVGMLAYSAAVFASEVSVVQQNNKITIRNQFYQAEFDGNKGFTMSSLTAFQPAKRQISLMGELIFSADGEQEKYIGHYAAKPQEFHQSQEKVICTFTEKGPQKAAFALKWAFTGGSVVETVTFTEDSPLIKYDVELSFDRIMVEANYRLIALNLGEHTKGENVFYPDKKRVTSVYDTGFHSPCPTWKFAWNPLHNVGIGLIAPDEQGWSSIHYMMRSTKDGWNGDFTLMELQHKPLRYDKLPGKINFSFYVIAGGSLKLAEELSAAKLPKPKDVTLDEVWPKKLITRVGDNNVTTVAVTNQTSTVKTVTLVSKAIWDINNEKALDMRDLTLQPSETGRFEITWKGQPMNWGVTFRTEAFVDGKLLDSREEYCAVSNFPPAVAGISILNVGMAHQDGSESAWIERCRRGYIGVFEYYCWTPSTIDGLTPAEEEWEPHTESQAAYKTTLTKKFLKTLIDDAHANGVYVYSWITGLFNYRKGLENPELFQYCQNGQPSLYNGKIYGNTRFATGKPNAYNEDFAYKWGQEMGRSVDMFKWDGCRWDWNFIPNAPNDPLYSNLAGEIADWYDWRGVSSKELYPNPDITADKATKAWRRGVEENHPDFVYGTNFHAGADQFKTFPNLSIVQSTKSLVLFEYLLNYSKEQYSTWQKWAKNLTEACQRARPYGAQPMVGSMTGLLPGTVSRNLAQYICFASGIKWWEGFALPDGIDQSYKRYRFMVRFSEYYFDNAFRLIPENRRFKEVEVFGSSRIFWQQFVYERNKDGFRDMTVHLINLPESDYICQRHEPPSIKKNIVIKVSPQAGEKLVSAYAMLPNPKPNAIKLRVTDNSAVLPELIDAAIVLFRFEKNN